MATLPTDPENTMALYVEAMTNTALGIHTQGYSDACEIALATSPQTPHASSTV